MASWIQGSSSNLVAVTSYRGGLYVFDADSSQLIFSQGGFSSRVSNPTLTSIGDKTVVTLFDEQDNQGGSGILQVLEIN
jgi:hypothetical protein